MTDSFARLTPPQIAVANLQFGGKRDGHLDDPPDVTNLRKVGCAPTALREGHVCEFTVTINGIERPGIKARFLRAADRRLVIDD